MSEGAKGCETLKHLPRPAANPCQTQTPIFPVHAGALRAVPRELLVFNFVEKNSCGIRRAGGLVLDVGSCS